MPRLAPRAVPVKSADIARAAAQKRELRDDVG
jgi:hypothetical protein